MNGKVTTMKEAIKRNVEPGDLLFIGGAIHGTPSAAVAEIARQRINHLGLIAILVNLSPLIAEGLVDNVLTAYAMTDERQSYMLQRAKLKYGVKVSFKEYSHFGLALGLFAGYMGIPFMPTKSHLGSDMMKYNENIQSIDCPFTGGQIGVIKAVVPDVGIIHVQRCDAEGNAQRWGSMGVDFEGINASKKVIITTEKVVENDVIQRDPNRTIIPGYRVNAVVEQPFGAYPTHLAGCYNEGTAGFGGMGDEESCNKYLDNTIKSVKDWNEYLERLKSVYGNDVLEQIRIKNPLLSDPIITGM
jgi:glutaconate CoA-transferase, subunit A